MVFDPLYIQSGTLRNAVTIKSPTSTVDVYGQPSNTWGTVLSTKAAIKGVTQREVTESGNLIGQTAYTITIRYPGSGFNITSGQRVVGDTQTYLIQSVEDVMNRHRLLNLLCVVIDEAD
jgi:SPP1 family predicted phage head-tail adaptor